MNRTASFRSAWLRVAPLLAAALVAACADAPPIRFYSLLPAQAPPVRAAAGFRIDVQEVQVPAQVDMAQLVVRTGPEELVPVESRRWIAPLAQEIRNALAAELAGRLGTRDVHGLDGGDAPVYRVGLNVQRFDSALGGYARIDALWTLAAPGRAGQLSCFSSATEPVAPGYEALVAGHQRALAQIAGAIAAAVTAAQSGGAAPACPAA